MTQYKTFKTNDGVNLAYYDEGEGVPVILLSGYGASAQTWFSTSDALVAAGYRAVAFDKRFHGRSEKPDYGKKLSRMAKDLDELITHLGLGGAVLMGQSMGVSTILCYLSLFTDQDISGFIAIDQTPQMLNTAQWPYGMYGFDKSSMNVFFDDPIPNPIHHMPDPSFMAELARITGEEGAYDAAFTKEMLLDHAYASWLDALPNINVPSLFIAGRNSPFWPCEHALEMAKRTPNGRAVIIDDCGHAVNWEQPEACNKAILDFLGAL